MIRYSNLLRIIGEIKHLSRIQTSAISFCNKPLLNEPDPFGLSGEENVEELIQGIYSKPPPTPKPSSSTTNNTEGEVSSTAVDPDEELIKLKYAHLLRTRDQKELEFDRSLEAVRFAHFGEIRLDSENVVTVDGQFAPESEAYDDGRPKMLAEYLKLKRMRELKGQEQKIDTTTATSGGGTQQTTTRDSSVRASAVEEQVQVQKPQQTYEYGVQSRPKKTIGKPVPMHEQSSQDVYSPTTAPDPPKSKKVRQLEGKEHEQAGLKPTTTTTTSLDKKEGKMTRQYRDASVRTSTGEQRQQEPHQQKHEDGGKNQAADKGGDEKVSDDDYKPITVAEYLKLKKMKKLQALADAQPDITAKLGGREYKISQDSVNSELIRHVPKIYESSNYNEVTHEDMWFYLRKQICFQNDFLIALNKPTGIAMHNSTAECRHTIEDFLPDFAKYAKVPEVFDCHRLDKDTSGVLILAKNEQAATIIKQKFVDRTMLKLYFAITKNCPEIFEGTIKIPIGEGQVPNAKKVIFRAVLKPDLQSYNIKTMQKGCKEAVTKFKVVQSTQFAAFLEVRPETGLTHQIRVHLAHGLGCPIIGDHKYSHRAKFAPQRIHDELLHRINVKQSKVRFLPLHLHCSKMEFTMPDGFMSKPWHEPIFVHASPPKYFMHTLRCFNLQR